MEKECETAAADDSNESKTYKCPDTRHSVHFTIAGGRRARRLIAIYFVRLSFILYTAAMGIFKSKTKITLSIEGMTCEHCEMKVRHALDGVEGVKMVFKVDREKNQAIVDIADPEKATTDILLKAVADAGYSGSL